MVNISVKCKQSTLYAQIEIDIYLNISFKYFIYNSLIRRKFCKINVLLRVVFTLIRWIVFAFPKLNISKMALFDGSLKCCNESNRE